MSDLISRSALLGRMEGLRSRADLYPPLEVARQATGDVLTAPPVDAEPVVHGRWTPANYKPTRYDKCSICGKRKTIEEEFVYCPWCGTKMDGERKEDKA